jgi:hypothetical protein
MQATCWSRTLETQPIFRNVFAVVGQQRNRKRFLPMPLSDRHSLRLVIQRVRDDVARGSSYRIIAYSDERTYRASQFDSLHLLLKSLKVALPDFDASVISSESATPPESSILFADVVELTDAQLALIGLHEYDKYPGTGASKLC